MADVRRRRRRLAVAHAAETAIAEAIARALVEVLGDPQVLARAWLASAPLERTLGEQTHSGRVQVCVRAPYARAVAIAATSAAPVLSRGRQR